MKNAVIYARFSSQGQNEQTIESQIRKCREFAAYEGYNIIKTYSDKARTGTNDSRPDFQRMIKEAASGAFQCIIVYMFDRFARNRHDSIMHKEMLKQKYDIRVISATQPISDDEGGEFYEMFLEWNDEKYSKRLSKRVHNGLDTCVMNGTYTGARIIYGYKLIDTGKMGKSGMVHKVAVDEEQAETVRFVFEEYAKGATKKEIAAALNAQGKRFRNKPFTGRTFDLMLVNSKYTGEFYLGKRLCTTMFPQIIDKAVFAQVQKLLAKNKYFAGANSAIEPYLLTGKLYCGHCGTAMISDGGTSRNGKKHYYYVCKSRKKGTCNKLRENKETLEMKVVKAVQEFLSDEKNTEKVATDTINYYERRTGDNGMKSIETRIAQTQQQIEDLTTAFIEAKNALLRANIEKRMNEYQIMLDTLQAEKSQIVLERGRRYTKDDIIDFIAELLKGDPADEEYQKKIIDNLVFMLYIYDDDKFDIVGYFNIKVDKSIEKVRLEETNAVLERLRNVQTQSAIASQFRRKLN
ncbi:MAG: recombinase family protein [Muribaculaceae bacterium]|nr:recombinase family protein [Muribaculaceae bacterium]